MEEKIKHYCKEKYNSKKTILMGKHKTNLGRTLYLVEMVVEGNSTHQIRKFIDEKDINRY